MPPSRDPRKKKHPSTYFVQQQEQKDEFQRLTVQGQMLTTAMGGPLAEQEDQAAFKRVLDVACGTGDWLVALAQVAPDGELVGVDVNPPIVHYAMTQAASVPDATISFHVMDALKFLDFPEASFDLVNQRLGQSYVRTWEWPRLLSEFRRLCRPDGVVRLTEAETVTQSSSPAVVQLGQIFTQALHSAGHYFTPDSQGITSHLARLLQSAGFFDVAVRSYFLECRGGTPDGERFATDVRHLFRVGLPFFQKWTKVPANYEQIYQQALLDMQQADFVATWNVHTFWGKR